MLDRYLARTAFDSQQTDLRPPSGRRSLFRPVDRTEGDDHGAHGIFDDQAHRRSFEAALARHPAAAASALVLGVTVAARAVLRLRGRGGTG
ncbi:hypothetical protein AB0D09_11025 [Streptomyces sp. NPDC049097]|uniref:hypothetical protein n=1 Tax=Streptomyces sp. NPDC049097 TaxID=3155497 RepID=UPI00343130A4